ncbi:MAG: hypothetical protein JXB88_18730 [Spirochaetales bacterium]|nr:hypothetical protein [Spirochaetales bacterium]
MESFTFLNGKIKNKAGLTDEAINLLIKDFSCLTPIDSSLLGRILHYLLDGDDPEILAELEVLDIFFKALYFAPRLKSIETRTALFKANHEQSEDFLHRLGKIYHALMNPLNPNHLMPQRLESPSWLEALLLFASSSYTGDLKTYVELKIVEKILQAAEAGMENMVQYIFLEDPTDFSHCNIIKTFFSLTGFSSSAVHHFEIIRQALAHIDNNTKYRALRNITALSLPVLPLLPEICQCCTASLKKVRMVAIKIIKDYPDQAIPCLKHLITKADPSKKEHAVEAYLVLSPEESENNSGDKKQ